MEEKGTVFLDPNTFSEDGTTAVSQTAWTEDGALMAYGVSEKGSDWVTVKVCESVMFRFFQSFSV